MRKIPLPLHLVVGLALLVLGLVRSPLFLNESITSNWWMLVVSAFLAAMGFHFWSVLKPLVRLAVFSTSNGLFYGVLFALGAVLYTGVALGVFDAMPRIPEEASSLFQSKVFADGRLWAETGVLHDLLKNPGMIEPAGRDTGLISMYPPSWPALLAFGSFFDLAWLVNPLLGGGLACAVSLLGCELHGKRVGRVAGLLCLLSPMFLVLNGSYLGHTFPTLCLVVCAWATIRLVRSAKDSNAVTAQNFGLLAGLMMAAVLLCRPASGLLVGMCIALIPVCAIARWRRFGKGVLLAIGCAGLGVLGLMLWQQTVTGDWRTPVLALGDAHGASHAFGVVGPEGFGPAEAMTLTRDRIGYADDRLLGWPVSGCLLLAALFLLRRAGWWDLWCLLPVATLTLFFHFNSYDDYFFRGRYLAEGLPFLLLPLARLLLLPMGGQRRWLAAGLIGCVAFAATVAVPFQLARFTPVYGDYIPHVLQMEQRVDMSHSVVFVTAPTRWPNDKTVPDLNKAEHGFYCPYFTAGFVRNRPDFNGSVVYVRHGVDSLALDVGLTQMEQAERGIARNLEVMQHFAGRRTFVIEFHRENNRAKYFQVWPNADFSGFEKVVELEGMRSRQ